jgi:glycosyltransferase involved in cell wall biosynthesis
VLLSPAQVPAVFDGLRVAVLIAAYNEATQIAGVIRSIPAYVSDIVVVNDASTDTTAAVVRAAATLDPRVQLIDLPENRGVGGALAVAYIWAREHDVDVAVTVDGDGQMDPAEMADLIAPIADGVADYTKGNRLHDPSAWRVIPRVRLVGNAVLSLLTKVASGYWAVADSQSGFTAAGRFALQRVDWEAMYPRYGRPNDVLVLANVADCRVADVPVRPIYGVGEQSSMKIIRVIFAISWLLFRRFWWRLFHKYLLQDFHPLLFFYLLATSTAVVGFGLAVRLFWLWYANGAVPPMTALATAFVAITSLNALFFANWMDMQANEHLAVKLTRRRSSESTTRTRAPSDPT